MTKILLVEDDKSLREIYGVRLLAEGYDIVSAGDGEEALAMAIKERPELIVSDVMMPKISGFDMLDILRSTTETKDIKVIMMTALSSEDQRARGEALGADRYLVKSQVGIEDVVRTVHDVLHDAPVAGGNTQQFSQPAQPTAQRPAPAIPSRQPAAQPSPAPAPQFAQQPQQAAPPLPTTPSFQPAAQPAPNGLPQPTAPFSTNRPASLGERVIHPLTQAPAAGQKSDISSLIDQELSKLSDQPAPVTPPPAPVAQPLPAMPVAPQPVAPPNDAPSAPQPPEPPQQVAPAPPLAPSFHPGPQPPAAIPSTPPQPTVNTPKPPLREDSGISFEETPRPPFAPQSPTA